MTIPDHLARRVLDDDMGVRQLDSIGIGFGLGVLAHVVFVKIGVLLGLLEGIIFVLGVYQLLYVAPAWAILKRWRCVKTAKGFIYMGIATLALNVVFFLFFFATGQMV